jgi:glutamyl/glutaminyl-tRNA synthetase
MACQRITWLLWWMTWDCGITWVIRGSVHLSNSPKHIILWRALGKLEWSGAAAPMPLWTYLGLITSNGKKISKRDGAAWFRQLSCQ